jgi:hypothetical protein
MENIFEILAVLVFLGLTGMQGLSKKMRDNKNNQKKSGSYKPAAPSKPSPLTPVYGAETKSEYAYKEKSQQTQQKKESPFTMRKDAQAAPTPQPASKPNEPIWSKMLREMLNVEEAMPEIVDLPKQPKPKKKMKAKKPPEVPGQNLKKRTRKVMPQSVQRRSIPSTLAAIVQQAETEPLKSAIILSEIFQPPRSHNRNRAPFA